MLPFMFAIRVRFVYVHALKMYDKKNTWPVNLLKQLLAFQQNIYIYIYIHVPKIVRFNFGQYFAFQ